MAAAGKVKRGAVIAAAARYGNDPRSVKRWVKRGREAAGGPDLPPLEDPVAMLEWWPKHFRRPVPEGVVAAAAKLMPPKESLPCAPVLPPESVPPVSGAGESPIQAGPAGYSHMLARVRAAEAEAAAEYERARASKDDGKIASAFRNWREIGKQLRELERDEAAILEGSGQTLRKDDIREALATLHAPIVNGMRGIFRKIRLRLEAAGSDVERDQIYQAEVDRVCGQLIKSEFAFCD